MDERRPMISVVVGSYNGAETIERCIDSVARQTYPNKELIVIDGGSADGTADILARRSDDIDTWVSEPDNGLSDAWNKAVKVARGDWILFLGVDDALFDERSLECMAPHLAERPERIVYGLVTLVDKDGRPITDLGLPWERVKRRMLQVNVINHQGTFHHRSLFEEHGPFLEDMFLGCDYEFLLRELKDRDAHFVSDCRVAAMGEGGVSTQTGQEVAKFRACAEARRRNNIRVFPWLWALCMARAYVWVALTRLLGPEAMGRVGRGYRRALRAVGLR